MKKLLTVSLLLTTGFGANHVLADHRDHGHSHTEYVCHETGSHYHDSHHYSGRHSYHGHGHNHHSSQVTYTYYSRQPSYHHSYHRYERTHRYHNNRHYNRSSTRVRVNHGLNGSLNLRF